MSDAKRTKRGTDAKRVPRTEKGGALSGLRGRLRQRRFPPEFRIPATYPPLHVRELAPGPDAHTPAVFVPALSVSAVSVPHQQAAGQAESTAAELPPQAPDSALADLATNLWRLDKKLAEDSEGGEGGDKARDGAAGGGQSATNRRRAARHLRAAQDALGKAGVKAQDHDGMAFDMGLALDVLAYQPVPDATRETVHETVRPSVYRDGRRIQLGQVIVARPEGDQDHEPRDR